VNSEQWTVLESLLHRLGFRLPGTGDGGSVEFFLQSAPRSWMALVALVLAAAAVYGVYVLYRTERVGVPRAVRMLLVGLRVATILLLLLVLMQPGAILVRETRRNAEITVLVDTSLSMDMRDTYRNPETMRYVTNMLGRAAREAPPRRADIAATALARDNGALLAALARKGNVQVAGFADSLEPWGRLERQAAGSVQTNMTSVTSAIHRAMSAPDGVRTRIGEAVRGALQGMRGLPSGGIVLVTDGRDTDGEWAASAAEACRREKVPLYCVGIGESAPQPNVRVSQVWAPERVFKEDPFQIEARIEYASLEADAIDLTLSRRPADRPDAASEVVERRRLRVSGAQGTIPARIQAIPAAAGTWAYEVTVAKIEGEQVLADNSGSAIVAVMDRRMRVLVVSGEPSWEYRMVRNMLLRDRSIEVACWLQSLPKDAAQEGTRPIGRLPRTREEWFSYDVIMYLDPSPAPFDAEWAMLMRDFAGQHAGGVLWFAGPSRSPEFFAAQWAGELVKLLPVEPEPLRASDAATGKRYDREHRIKVSPDAMQHALMRFREEPAANRDFVESLPGFFWAHPVRALKPGATVLLSDADRERRLTDGSPAPLMVSGFYGAGRVLFLGISGTWRWRRVNEAVFDHWWVQTTRYLAESRLQRGGARGRIATDNDRFTVGNVVQITAQFYTESYLPLKRESVEVSLLAPGTPAVRKELAPVSGIEGRYAGTCVASKPGLHVIECTLPAAAGSAPEKIKHQFMVELPTVEYRTAEMAREALALAATNSGGAYLDIHELDTLDRRVEDRTETVALPQEPVSLWDNWLLLLLAVILLGAEWAIKRQYQMI
jgi:hypothetical protein